MSDTKLEFRGRNKKPRSAHRGFLFEATVSLCVNKRRGWVGVVPGCRLPRHVEIM